MSADQRPSYEELAVLVVRQAERIDQRLRANDHHVVGWDERLPVLNHVACLLATAMKDDDRGHGRSEHQGQVNQEGPLEHASAVAHGNGVVDKGRRELRLYGRDADHLGGDRVGAEGGEQRRSCPADRGGNEQPSTRHLN